MLMGILLQYSGIALDHLKQDEQDDPLALVEMDMSALLLVSKSRS